jgi:hypothetical protein
VFYGIAEFLVSELVSFGVGRDPLLDVVAAKIRAASITFGGTI